MKNHALPSHSWCSLHSIVPEIKYMKINKYVLFLTRKNHETSQTNENNNSFVSLILVNPI